MLDISFMWLSAKNKKSRYTTKINEKGDSAIVEERNKFF